MVKSTRTTVATHVLTNNTKNIHNEWKSNGMDTGISPQNNNKKHLQAIRNTTEQIPEDAIPVEWDGTTAQYQTTDKQQTIESSETTSQHSKEWEQDLLAEVDIPNHKALKESLKEEIIIVHDGGARDMTIG